MATSDGVCEKSVGIETQELLYSLLMELYPDLLLDLADQTTIDERYDLIPEMRIGELKRLIQTNYDWAFQYDFSDPDEVKYFWYRSKEKEEPRMGERGVEPGEELELPVNIAQQIQQLNQRLQNRPIRKSLRNLSFSILNTVGLSAGFNPFKMMNMLKFMEICYQRN